MLIVRKMMWRGEYAAKRKRDRRKEIEERDIIAI